MPSHFYREFSRDLKTAARPLTKKYQARARQYMYKKAGGAGAAVGRALAGKKGARLGRVMGAQFAKKAEGILRSHMLSGNGDYVVGRGIHDGGRMSDHPSKHHHKSALEKGEMIIEHTEYIGDLISSNVNGTSNFTSQYYELNPGNPVTFPWLSDVAINFQDYRFEKLVFEVRPLVSESTSTTSATLTSMGSVVMATQYDTVLGGFVNKQTMENSDFAVSIKPSQKALHAVECDPRFNPLGVLYVSGGNNINPNTGVITTTPGIDLRMQDLGLFQIASCNIPVANNSSINLMEIFVHYKICLMKPVLNAGLTNVQTAHYVSNTGVTSAQPFGTSQTVEFDNIGLTITPSSVVFPASISTGSYMLTWQVSGTANANPYIGPTITVANGSLKTVWNSAAGIDTSTKVIAPSSVAGSTCCIVCCIFTVSSYGNSQCSITFSGQSNIPPTSNEIDLWIVPVNSQTK